jgi:hypothetical protein
MRHRSPGAPTTRSLPTRRLVGSAAALAVLAASGIAVAIGTSSAAGGNLLANAGFESGTMNGWDPLGGSDHLAVVAGGHSGSHMAKLWTSKVETVALKDSPNVVTGAHRGDRYLVSAYVRTATPKVTAALRIREVRGGGTLVNDQAVQRTLTDTGWHKLSFTYTVKTSGDALDYNVLAIGLKPGKSLLVDDTWMSLTSSPGGTSSPTSTPKPTSTPTPTPAPGGSYTGTLIGTSIYQEGNETFAEAYNRRARAYGGLHIDRVFYNGLPAGWPGTAGYAGTPVVVSFNVLPQKVLTGAYDTQITNWFKAAPHNRTIYWNYWHEPENDVERGHFTTAQFRAAYARVATLAKRAANPQLKSTLVLMCYTLEAFSHRSFAAYYPGSASVDVLAWDCYNHETTSYIQPSVQFQHVIATSASTGKPFGVAELGSRVNHNDPSGSGRAAWLRATATFLAQHHARFVTYFDSPVGTADYRLRDTNSINAWKWCIGTY